MKKRITVENIDAIINDASDLEHEETLACQVGNYHLNRYEALIRELDDLKFHVAKFADEGATLAEINAYDDIINHAEKSFKKEDYFECAKTLTSLKLLFGLDVTFFTLLPYIREEIKDRYPLTFESLISKARNNDNNDNSNNFRR